MHGPPVLHNKFLNSEWLISDIFDKRPILNYRVTLNAIDDDAVIENSNCK